VREVTEASRRACGAPQPPRRRSTQVVEERVAAGGTRLETPATTHDPDAPPQPLSRLRHRERRADRLHLVA
jgi:hypothetical protein